VKTSVHGMQELARLYGVETAYEGMGGQRHRADPEALALTLGALGAQIEGSTPRQALRARRAELEALPIQPVHVAWDGRLAELRIRLPHADRERAAIEIRLESGEVLTQPADAEPGSHRPRAGWKATHSIRLGRRLPIGYHRIQVETAGATFDTLVIAPPRTAYVVPDARDWGVFIPLYALQTDEGWCTGDYGDLATLAEWAGRRGASFVSTLPLLAAFLEEPFDPSPYSPASRLFWNELFIDMSQVPGARAPDGRVADELRECRAGDYVDYRRAAAVRRREIEHAVRETAGDAGVQAELRQFETSFPRVIDYARFRAVCDRQRQGWPGWPARLREGTIQAADFASGDYDYHLFAQWQADRQLAAIHAASEVGAAALYLDMPLGVHPDSYDCWRMPELFARGVSAGAPPDTLFTGGQDWGFRPLNPVPLRASGYAYLIDVIRLHLRHARMLRLDHVMSLYRLFWVPSGMSAREGVYVRYPQDELFAILVLESARHRAVVIGEDLGTVPDAVRRTMDRHQIQRMSVLQYEASPDPDVPLAAPAENVVASLNTHDMPTFAGFWRGSEIDDQLDLGLIDRDAHAEALHVRSTLRQRISRSIGAGGVVEPGLARQRLLERLADSSARYLLINLEDLWLEDRPQNVPGTSDERPNWKRRARRSLPEIMEDAAIGRMLESIAVRRTRAHATHE
jgi:4-alpha-glucanotransferase